MCRRPSSRRTRAPCPPAPRGCTTTAWGDWADWVPKGKVGVIAKRLVSVNHLGRPTFGEDEVCALIDNDTYETRGEVTTLSSVGHEIIDAPENLRPKRLA